MWFYGPIFYFHIGLGVLLTLLLLSQSRALEQLLHRQGQLTDVLAIVTSVIAMVAFVWAFWRYRPSKLRWAIERECRAWRNVLGARVTD
jgi:hypothetical protein